jgi:Peptidase S46
MRFKATLFNLLLAALIAAPASQPVQADEGMWTFDNFPSAQVKQLYGVDITPEWLDRVRLATVRLAGRPHSYQPSLRGLLPGATLDAGDRPHRRWLCGARPRQ